MLSKYRGTIGWLTMSSLLDNSSIKILSLDGIRPSPENIRTGSYPLSIHYSFVYKKGRLQGLARKFVDFVFSEAGAKILTENSIIPLKAKI